MIHACSFLIKENFNCKVGEVFAPVFFFLCHMYYFYYIRRIPVNDIKPQLFVKIKSFFFNVFESI